jgi:hypothetical protein
MADILEKIPFSVYDFFAYLSSGAVLVATADYIWGLGLLSAKEVGPVLAVALVILAYVLGHIVAHFSSFLLEQLIVQRLLKGPAALLLGVEPRLRLFKWIFPNYHRQLAKNVQQRVRERAASRGCAADGEGLFQHVYPLVTQTERYQARLDDFRNQYGFARNVSFAFLISAIAISVAHWGSSKPLHPRWSVLAAIAGVSLFYRYLKFFRQYSYELLIRYSESPQITIAKEGDSKQ